jgi:hypothetical protein
MREFYKFHGRGHASAKADSCYLLETGYGVVLEITETHGKAEFIVGYCRKALADRWGICCFEPFKRASDPGLTRTWAEHSPTGLFIFRGVRLHLTREEEWMRRRE